MSVLASVTVVIPCFYPERERYLATILEALATATVIPEQVLLWNNDPTPLTLPLGDGRYTPMTTHLVESPYNVGCQARFLAALMARTDYVLFQDNDMVLEPEALENLLGWSATHGGVLTLEGSKPHGGHYRHWWKLRGATVTQPEPVTISLGRGELVRRVLLPRYLCRFPFEAATIMDDLYFSAGVLATGDPITVVPATPRTEGIRNLPRHGTGLSADPTWNDQRDALVRTLFGDGHG